MGPFSIRQVGSVCADTPLSGRVSARFVARGAKTAPCVVVLEVEEVGIGAHCAFGEMTLMDVRWLVGVCFQPVADAEGASTQWNIAEAHGRSPVKLVGGVWVSIAVGG